MATTVENIPGKTWPVASSKQVLAPTISTAISLSSPAAASWALIQPLGANIRWWEDGSAPTVSQGFRLADGVYLEFTGDLKAFRAIAESGTPSVQVSYYRSGPSGTQS